MLAFKKHLTALFKPEFQWICVPMFLSINIPAISITLVLNTIFNPQAPSEKGTLSSSYVLSTSWTKDKAEKKIELNGATNQGLVFIQPTVFLELKKFK